MPEARRRWPERGRRDVKRTLTGLFLACAMVTTVAAAGQAAADDWTQTITAQIQAQEYHFSEQAAGVWSAPNRVQDLRATLKSGRLELSPRTSAGWSFNLE